MTECDFYTTDFHRLCDHWLLALSSSSTPWCTTLDKHRTRIYGATGHFQGFFFSAVALTAFGAFEEAHPELSFKALKRLFYCAFRGQQALSDQDSVAVKRTLVKKLFRNIDQDLIQRRLELAPLSGITSLERSRTVTKEPAKACFDLHMACGRNPNCFGLPVTATTIGQGTSNIGIFLHRIMVARAGHNVVVFTPVLEIAYTPLSRPIGLSRFELRGGSISLSLQFMYSPRRTSRLSMVWPPAAANVSKSSIGSCGTATKVSFFHQHRRQVGPNVTVQAEHVVCAVVGNQSASIARSRSQECRPYGRYNRYWMAVDRTFDVFQ
ncbi:hypothetical protein D9619_004597 [Psilocybe cf. subviscida]|uniref:Uncharacterized protein n=1 Tax=Psilocybe cf. subviscida TaxID=2480587 RepID=A0A8H5F8N7_9AGAR|nr:hypothetical protein D9619_004597 [Psilocybe cf. subviscida]